MRENTILNIILASVAANAVASVAARTASVAAHTASAAAHTAAQANQKSTIYLDPTRETFDEMKWKFSNYDRVNFLFDIIDSDPKDGHLYYNELYLFQKATEPNPQLALTLQLYKDICKLFGSNPHTGLTKAEFNSSYYLYSNTLGTDLERDFSIILDKYLTYHTGNK